MGNNSRILATLGSVLLVSAMTFGAYSWLSNRSIRRAKTLQEQLFDSAEMPMDQKNKLKLELMRTVDEMDREQVRELYDQLMEEYEEQQQQEIAAFHTASEEQKVILLNHALERWAQAGEVYWALRSDGVPREGRYDRAKESTDQGERALSDEQRAEQTETRRQRDEYYQALKAPEEIGDAKNRRNRKGG